MNNKLSKLRVYNKIKKKKYEAFPFKPYIVKKQNIDNQAAVI